MIYEKTCPTCGTVFKTDRIVAKFCCHRCANSSVKFIGKEKFDPDIEWYRVPTDKHKWQCPYETEVACKLRRCDKCGWNPEVAKERLEAYNRKYMEEHYGRK